DEIERRNGPRHARPAPAPRRPLRARLSRPAGPGTAAYEPARGPRPRADLYAAHAEERTAALGAHVQLRTARLGDPCRPRRVRARPPGDRAARAADAGAGPRGLAGAGRLPPSAGMLPDQLLWAGRQDGAAPGSRRSRAGRPGRLAFAWRRLPVPHRRDETQ